MSVKNKKWYHCKMRKAKLSGMIHEDFISFYSRTFPRLCNKIQGVHFLRHSHYCVTILHILHSHANKPIPVGTNNVLKQKDNSYFLCIKNHSFPLSIINVVSSLFFWIYFRTTLRGPLERCFELHLPCGFVCLEGLHNTLGKRHWRRGFYFVTLNKKHWIVLIQNSNTFLSRC